MFQIPSRPLVSNVVGGAPDEVKSGMAGEAVFEDFPEYTLAKFRPVKHGLFFLLRDVVFQERDDLRRYLGKLLIEF